MNKLDTVQVALDVAGIEPTVGTAADGTNAVISLLRAAAADERDSKKKHLINAGISAISMVPFADVVKIFKFKPARKLAVKGARAAKKAATTQKASGTRFNEQCEAYLSRYTL